MNDQARALRGLVEQHADAAVPLVPAGRPRACTIALTSGKGGVGKSVIALNLACALAHAQQKVVLLDANLGLGNLDLLCGLNGYWNLGHVISGARTLAEIVLDGPFGVKLLPGASGLQDVADCAPAAQRDVLSQLGELEATHDFLVIDTATGIHQSVRHFVAAADIVLVVTTPELTSIANAYATLKSLAAIPDIPEPEVLVNQSASPEQAREIMHRLQQTARTFVHTHVSGSGFIPHDTAVPDSVARRLPFLAAAPRAPVSRAIHQLARRMINTRETRLAAKSFFERYQHATESKAA